MKSNPEMTTTKIDRASLKKLRMLAERESRSAPSQLKIIVDAAWNTNPAGDTENARLASIMDDIVNLIEAGDTTEAARADAAAAKLAGVISWGSENGVVIGTMVDGTRVDVAGNILATLDSA